MNDTTPTLKDCNDHNNNSQSRTNHHLDTITEKASMKFSQLAERRTVDDANTRTLMKLHESCPSLDTTKVLVAGTPSLFKRGDKSEQRALSARSLGGDTTTTRDMYNEEGSSISLGSQEGSAYSVEDHDECCCKNKALFGGRCTCFVRKERRRRRMFRLAGATTASSDEDDTPPEDDWTSSTVSGGSSTPTAAATTDNLLASKPPPAVEPASMMSSSSDTPHSVVAEPSASTTTMITTPTLVQNSTTTPAKKKVQFNDKPEVHKIKSFRDMSRKEVRNTYWNPLELADHILSYNQLRKLYQKCTKRQCCRGLEMQFMDMLEYDNVEGCDKTMDDFIQEWATCDEDEFSSNVRPSSFLGLNRNDGSSSNLNSSSSNLNASARDLNDTGTSGKAARVVYKNYSRKCSRNAHTMGLLDEAYVFEHVYGRKISEKSKDALYDIKYSSMRACSCYKNECRRDKIRNSKHIKACKVRRSLFSKIVSFLFGKRG